MRNSSLERNRMFIRFFGFCVRFSGSASGVVLWGRVIAAGRARDGLLAIGGWSLRGVRRVVASRGSAKGGLTRRQPGGRSRQIDLETDRGPLAGGADDLDAGIH